MPFDWDNYSANVSAISPKMTDVPILLDLNGVEFESGNSYTIKIQMSQEGDPWDLVETETHRFVINP